MGAILTSHKKEFDPKDIEILTFKQAELELGLRSGTLAEARYRGHLPDDCFVVVGPRRAIFRGVLEDIRAALRRAGKLPKPAVLRA